MELFIIILIVLGTILCCCMTFACCAPKEFVTNSACYQQVSTGNDNNKRIIAVEMTEPTGVFNEIQRRDPEWAGMHQT